MQAVAEAERIVEMVGGEPYEYVVLGRHVVSAPGVCGGRPTFKYTRVEVAGVLELIAAGWGIDALVADYDRPEITRPAIEEAIRLAGDALVADWAAPKAMAA